MQGLNYARKIRIVEGFLSIGREPENTLKYSYWNDLVQKLNDGIANQDLVPEVLPEEAVSAVLRHYHETLYTASQVVLLSQQQWRDWYSTLSEFHATDTDSVAKVRSSCLEAFSSRYQVFFTYTSEGFLNRLQNLSRLIENAEPFSWGGNGAQEEGPNTDPNRLINALTEHYSAVLSECNAMSFFYAHLFSQHNVIGEMERAWLSELLDIQGTTVEGCDAAIDALQRRSFKRDLSVATASTEYTMELYNAFEIDNGKKSTMQTLAERTRHSAWWRAANEWYTAVNNPGAESLSSMYLGYTEKEGKLLDNLSSALASSPVNCATAFGLSMFRLVEREQDGVLNPSRLEFFLFLLSKWFGPFVENGFKHPHANPFHVSGSDKHADAMSLWRFVLERHTVLLLHGLRFSYGFQGGVEGGSGDSSDHRYNLAITTVKTVALSVAHFQQLLLRSLTSSHQQQRSDVSEHAVDSIWKATQNFVDDYLLKRVFASLYTDLADDLDDVDDKKKDQFLAAEAELRLSMCTIQEVLCAPQRRNHLHTFVRRRVDVFLNELLDHLETRVDAADAPPSGAVLFTLALRVIETVANSFPASAIVTAVGPRDEHGQELAESSAFVVKSFKRLLKAMEARLSQSNPTVYQMLYPLVMDSWSRSMWLSANSDGVLLPYLSDTLKGERLLQDVYCEGRRAAKAIASQSAIGVKRAADRIGDDLQENPAKTVPRLEK